MNDLDPAKMTEAERQARFASFTQGMTPASPPRQTLVTLLAPWISSIRTQHAVGFDWKQLAQICAKDLGIKISARTLQNIVQSAGGAPERTSKTRRRRANVAPTKPPAVTPSESSGSPSSSPR
jgi:hypothetical protein